MYDDLGLVNHALGIVVSRGSGSRPRVVDHNLGVVDHGIGVVDHDLGIVDHDPGVVDPALGYWITT